ncbi:hypothetical protein AOLI_G00153620 [Acnodon oligacanthus]
MTNFKPFYKPDTYQYRYQDQLVSISFNIDINIGRYSRFQYHYQDWRIRFQHRYQNWLIRVQYQYQYLPIIKVSVSISELADKVSISI